MCISLYSRNGKPVLYTIRSVLFILFLRCWLFLTYWIRKVERCASRTSKSGAMRMCSRLWKRHLVGAGIGGVLATVAMLILLKKPPNVVIVLEEHHEALPYWIEAAEMGLLPFGGVTLVHMDAHSDDAIPELLPNMPSFNWPENDLEIAAMLQSNDVFIQEAIMIGLIERVVWVVPKWVAANISFSGELYDKFQRHLGATAVEGKNGTKQTLYCSCDFDMELRKRVCTHINHTAETREEEVVMQDFRKCRPIRTYSFEVITAEDLRDMQLTEAKFISDDQSVILDIDEDYFGCVLPGEALKAAQVPWNMIEVDRVLADFLCPKHGGHEESSAMFLKDLIKQVIQVSHADRNDHLLRVTPENFVTLQKYVVERWKDEPLLFCGFNDLHVRKTAVTFISVLLKFTENQIKTITEVGFCLNNSPVTFSPEEARMVVCKGSNDPDDSMVTNHSPTIQEIQDAMVLLGGLIELLPTPSVVTVCRSIRDGYTPRAFFKEIEDGLMEVLRRLFPSGGYKYIYDDNLWLGPLGLRKW